VTASDPADVLVVGASFAGVACAIEAARAGLYVILIERKPDNPVLETSGRRSIGPAFLRPSGGLGNRIAPG
jgi:flavin-dependent dehydrogenase